MRHASGLATTPKRTLNLTDQEQPLTTKRRHGIRRENLHIDKEQLLEEARLWGALEKVNWSELGTKYGVKGANRGENIKEFVAGYEIEATKQQQRKHRAPRRAKKRVQGSRLTVPMPPPASYHREKEIDGKRRKGRVYTWG